MADTITHYITADRFLSKGNFSADFVRGMRFGVQGPDPFFFGKDKGSFAFGDKLHDCAPKLYFEIESDSIGKMSELYKGYYFGVMLHYFEDRIMHQYVGYLCRKYPSPTTHGSVEREFDIVLYQKEYGKKIKTFDVKKHYKVSLDVIDVVHSFWSKRVEDDILTVDFVKTSLQRCFSLTSKLLKANPILIALVKAKEKQQGMKGVLSCHFKTGYSEENMNLCRTPWQGEKEQFTLSVPDIVAKGLTDFEQEYNKVNQCFSENKPYIFTHTQWFSCGK